MTWQNKLLPLMTRMLIGLTVFFFLASFVQLFYLHQKIENSQKLNLNSEIKIKDEIFKDSSELQLELIEWKTLATLDEYTLNQRYHQANVLLMARIWTRYLSFVTGMILCLVGASFILGRIELTTSEIDGKTQFLDFSVKTSSPGIILAVLGTVLMLTSVLVHNEIKVTDGPAYLHLKFQSVLVDKPKSLKINEESGSTAERNIHKFNDETRSKKLKEREELYKQLENELKNK